MDEDGSTEYQKVIDYIQDDCHFDELAQLVGKIEGKSATQVVELTRDLFEIWLLEKLLAQPENGPWSVQDVLKHSTDELLILSATDFSEYLLQGVFKDTWQLNDAALERKFGTAENEMSLQGKLNQAKLEVIQLADHQANVLPEYCGLLKAALVLNQKLVKIA